MAEYINVEKPFLEKHLQAYLQVIDRGNATFYIPGPGLSTKATDDLSTRPLDLSTQPPEISTQPTSDIPNYVLMQIQELNPNILRTLSAKLISITKDDIKRMISGGETLTVECRKNIQKYAPLYYPDYKVEIQNQEKFVLSISYTNLEADLAPDLAPDLVPDDMPQPQLQPQLQQELQQETLYSLILKALKDSALTTKEISEILGQKEKSGQFKKVIRKLNKDGLIERTIPDNPNNPAQRQKLTENGKLFLKMITKIEL